MADFVMSVQNGKLGKLPIVGDLSANNDKFKVDGEAGYVFTDGGKGTTKISELKEGGKTTTVTAVDWQANMLTAQEISRHPNYFISYLDGIIYATLGNVLYQSSDGLKSVNQMATLPFIPDNNPILSTPVGYFSKGENKVYRSQNLIDWTLEFEVNHLALYHMFDYHVSGDTVYIYTGEYHTLDSERCRVYRGTYKIGGNSEWETILEFRSRSEHLADPQNSSLFARHIHAVVVDPFNGNVYVNTGDSNVESKLMISEDNGDSFRKLGEGAQDWRCLSIWFTEKFIYWNMDSTAPQSIFRLARQNLSEQSITNDLRETVALLDNGSHWYHCRAIDEQGNDLIVMSSSAEGQIRDKNARLFGIRENNDESVTIDELIVMQSRNPDTYISHLQIEPKFQDRDGFVYCRGRETAHAGIYKFKLIRKGEVVRHNWVDPVLFTEK